VQAGDQGSSAGVGASGGLATPGVVLLAAGPPDHAVLLGIGDQLTLVLEGGAGDVREVGEAHAEIVPKLVDRNGPQTVTT
jgi:hypothetical protein